MRSCLLGVALLALSACDQPASVSVELGNPATKTPEPKGPRAVIIEVPARRALADAEVWLVDDGVSPLGTGVRKPSPAMIVHFVDDAQPILYNRLHRLTYHGHSAKVGQAFPVEDEDLVELGLEAPATAVWTFGPLGPCRATVGQPLVGRPSSGERVFEVSYALEGCAFEGRWAPAASTAAVIPASVTWREAEISEDAWFEPDAQWAHPLAPMAERPPSQEATAFVAHARWVSGIPRPAQTLVTAVGPAQAEACPPESHRATLGWWPQGEALQPIDLEVRDPADPPLLVGAIGWGASTAALVFDDGLDGLVAIPPSEDETLGPATWTVLPLVAGRWSEADRAAAALRIQTCN